ncbi:glycerol kinase GlpK [Ureaplasma miroungigenitalium]|uniref:glycerol kinase GlpK n=1 Tax=Ureaplasma miroungigenitalium TaxID=1042321 RepID=UPI0021E7EF63|nr:glycerol kinase GlpK [Ureaplasma miroungigenitalium]MCV3734425.1 glycerol kinase GlpK [Ureaplasma miroungigenitalium]
MKSNKYVIALDQGTTSCRSVIINAQGSIEHVEKNQIVQIFPQTSWVEQDANLIWNTQLSTLLSVCAHANLQPDQIACLGITNQRETIVCWNKKTGMPLYNAIVWQDQRTADVCRALEGYAPIIKAKTGLVLNAYFSASKIAWILKNVPAAQEALKNNDLLCGTIDSWLIWKLTKGKVHATDVSNASRTLLFNIHTLQYDQELLDLFDIPLAILPEVKPSGSLFGYVDPSLWGVNNDVQVPITGVLGDQQASLFGHLCLQPGMVKNTYGTGCFMLANTGHQIINSQHHLLSTVAWQIENEPTVYALEGSVFIAGAAIEWLKDGLRIIYNAKECDFYSNLVKDQENPVYLVPSFYGLGAPYWNSYAKGAIFGLDLDTKREHIVWACLQSIAYQTSDLLKAMQDDLALDFQEIKVDGGVSQSTSLMQFQSDIVQKVIHVHKEMETTSLGAGYLAGYVNDFFANFDQLQDQKNAYNEYTPNMDTSVAKHHLKKWNQAIQRVFDWSKE